MYVLNASYGLGARGGARDLQDMKEIAATLSHGHEQKYRSVYHGAQEGADGGGRCRVKMASLRSEHWIWVLKGCLRKSQVRQESQLGACWWKVVEAQGGLVVCMLWLHRGEKVGAGAILQILLKAIRSHPILKGADFSFSQTSVVAMRTE